MTRDHEEDDEMVTGELASAVQALRRMPPMPPGAVDRVLAATVARGRRRVEPPRRREVPAWWWRAAAGIVIVGSLGTVAIREARRASAPEAAVERVAAPSVAIAPDAGVVAASSDAAPSDAPLPTTFVLHRPDAARVSVVGDFNGWNPAATALTRAPDGTWSVTLPLTPGRHGYAFVVDGGAWVTDPRAALERDPDYGRDHSVVVVGAP